MDKIELGSEVQLNVFESICIFMGCKIKDNDEQARELDELCRYLAAERCSFNPHKNMFVGVFLSNNKWARGEIKEVYERAAFSEYKVFLIDHGSFLKVKKSFLVPLNESVKYPPQHMRIGLYGVIPNVTMSKKYELVLADLLHEGPVYFQERKLVKNTVFGNILIKSVSKTAIIDLTTVLLKRRLVKKVENFEEEIKQFLNTFEENQPESSRKTGTVHKVRDKGDNEIHTLKEERKNVSPSKNTQSSGYFSSDEESNFPYAHEDAIFVPAGMQYPSAKISNKKFEREPIKVPRTFFEILRDKSKTAEHRSRSRSKHHVKAENETNQLSTVEIQNYNLKETESRYINLDNKPDLITKQPVFKSKHITWGNDSNPAMPVKISDDQSQQKKSRAFNLNLNSEKNKNSVLNNTFVIGPKTASSEAEHVNIEDNIPQAHKPENVVSNILPEVNNENSPTSKVTSLSSTDNHTTSSHIPALQNLKLKYKAAKALMTSTNNTELDPIKCKPEWETTKSIDSFKSTTISKSHLSTIDTRSSNASSYSLQTHNSGIVNNMSECTKNSSKEQFIDKMSTNGVNKYVNRNMIEKFKEPNENELITIISSQGKGSNCKEMKIQHESNTKPYDPSSLKSIRKLPMREKYKKLKEMACASDTDVSSHISDDTLPLSTSLNSLSSEAFHEHFSDKVEILKKLNEKMAPTEEQLRKHNHVCSSEMRFIPQTGIMCINKSAGVLVHSHDNKMVSSVTSLSDSGLDIHIIQAKQDR